MALSMPRCTPSESLYRLPVTSYLSISLVRAPFDPLLGSGLRIHISCSCTSSISHSSISVSVSVCLSLSQDHFSSRAYERNRSYTFVQKIEASILLPYLQVTLPVNPHNCFLLSLFLRLVASIYQRPGTCRLLYSSL